MSQPLRLLMVEDSDDDATLLLRELRRAGYAVMWERVDTPAAMRAALERQAWDVVTSDHAMPKFSAPAALALLKELRPELPFIIVSNEINLSLAVSLMKAGAQDYIQKRELAQLGPAIQRELRDLEVRRERGQAEAALRESEKKHRDLAELLPEAAFEADLDGRLTFVNQRAFEMFGYGPADLAQGVNVFDLAIPEDRPLGWQNLERLLSGGDPQSTLYRALRKDGSLIQVELRAAVSWSDGRPTGLRGVVTDVTERVELEKARQQAQETLRHSEELFRSCFELPLVGGCIISPTKGWLAVNDKLCELLGYPRDELLQTPWEELTPPEERAGETALLDGLAASPRNSATREKHYLRKDGSRIKVRVSTQCVRTATGAVDYLVSAVHDLTSPEPTERALRESEERLRQITSSLREAVWLRDARTLALLYVNPAYETIWGRSVESFYQDPTSFVAAVHPEDKGRVMQAIEAQSRGVPFDQEYRIVRPDGSLRWVWGRTFPVLNAAGEVYRMVAVVEDITARKATGGELEEQIVSEHLLARLSTTFFNLPAAEVEAQIVQGLQQVVEWLGVDRGSVLEFSPGESGFQIRFDYEIPGPDHPSAVPPLFTARDYPEYFRLLHAGLPAIMESVADLPLGAAPERGLTARVHLKTHVAVPMTAGSTVWGAVAFSSFTREHAWPPETITHLRLIGEVFVNALRRKEAEEATAQRNRELETIGQLIGTIATNLNLQEILDQVLHGALELTNLEGGTLCLVRPDAHTLTLAAARNASPQMVAELSAEDVRVGDCLCGQVALTGEPLILWDDASASAYATREAVRKEGLRFHGAFPLSVKDRTIGVLCLFARSDRRPTQRQLELVQQVCGPIALAIDNAQLYEQAHRHAAEMERRVTERTLQLAAMNQELEAFSYTVAHDLRAPLRVIDGFSQVLLEDFAGPLGPEGTHALERIQAAGGRMGQLIDDLLELSRVTRGELNRTRLDLSALAQTIASDLRQRDPQRQVDFRISGGIIARADAALLRAALENLLGNAWKFTAKTADAIIEFGTFARERDNLEERVYFVRDNGAGFSMAHVDQLFKAFHRLHADDEFPGTGIGLATVQRIIRRHGGQVWAEGAVGQGATFYFSL
jgi:PAS domain S-box-containing protein